MQFRFGSRRQCGSSKRKTLQKVNFLASHFKGFVTVVSHLILLYNIYTHYCDSISGRWCIGCDCRACTCKCNLLISQLLVLHAPANVLHNMDHTHNTGVCTFTIFLKQIITDSPLKSIYNVGYTTLDNSLDIGVIDENPGFQHIYMRRLITTHIMTKRQ